MMTSSKTLVTILMSLFLAVSATGQDGFVTVQDGRLIKPSGEEVKLWGVNLQTMISWEYNSMIRKAGIPKDVDVWKEMADKSLDEIEIMGANYIRVHLTPADFTDAEGKLVQTIYLDMLDYTTAEAAKRGIYLNYAFVHHMGGAEVPSSFMKASYDEARSISSTDYKNYNKNLNMFDEDYVEPTKVYMKALLNRVNPYNNTAYKADTSIITWGIMNEPIFLNYDQLKLFTKEYNRFKAWLIENGLTENNGVNYPTFRKIRLKEYINGIHDAIRSTGSVQPVEWSLNWNRFRRGRLDVFEAVSESKVEVVSFCTYPGQGTATSLGGGSYQNFKGDLSDYDFTDWFKTGYNDIDSYGWLLTDDFASKAKQVYEFEGFYNWSSYIYPAIADLQRSLGSQAAGMWHYSQPGYAEYNSGSHILNLKCTPHSAAGFAVAGKIYEATETEQDYHPETPLEFQGEKFMYSYTNNIAVYSDEESYFYSNNVPAGTLPAPHPNVKHIFGVDSSELVDYSGSGNYRIDIIGDTMLLNVQPDVSYNYPLYSREKALITNLDYDNVNTLKLKFWDKYGKYEIYKVEDNQYSLDQTVYYLTDLEIKPGKYKIYLGDTFYTEETEAPTAPANLAFSNIKPKRIDLSWDASTNGYIEKYLVYMNGELDTMILAPATSVPIDGLGCEVNYDFTVKAVTGAGNESPLSSVGSVTTDICDVTAPTVPQNLEASDVSAIGAQLTWRQSSDNIEVTDYLIYINGEKIETVSYPDTTVRITGLLCGSSNEIGVRAQDESGNISDVSSSVNIITPACSGYIGYEEWMDIVGWKVSDLTSQPHYPDNPDGSGVLNSLLIPANYSDKAYGLKISGSILAPETGTYYFWIASDNAGELWLSSDNTTMRKLKVAYNDTWTSYLEWNKSASQKSVGIPMLQGKKYYVEVLLKADDSGDHLAVGWRKPSDGEGDGPVEIVPGSALVPLMDNEAPSAPSNFIASEISGNSCRLSWYAASDNVGVVEYEVYRDGETDTTVWTTYVTIEDLENAHEYVFTLKARDAAGNVSEDSEHVIVETPDIEAPSAPANLAAVNIADTRVELNWNASYDNVRVIAYDIYMDAELETSVSDTSIAIDGLESNASYAFWISARDEAGNVSDRSNKLTITLTYVDGTEKMRNEVCVYPNPVSDKLYVSHHKSGKLKIYNLHGQLLIQTEYFPDTPIDVSALEAGSYFIRFEEEEEARVFLIVKNNTSL